MQPLDFSGCLVVGLGTGRSGTGSLARLLDLQHDAVCFHEMNPACVRFSGTPRPILNGIAEFASILDDGDRSSLTVDLSRKQGADTYDRLCHMGVVRLIGDVASYYLTYVRPIADLYPQVRFLCLRRDIGDTVRSFLRKSHIKRSPSRYAVERLASVMSGTAFYESENPWMEHSGTMWRQSALWDKLFPKFDAPSKDVAIQKYCEYYYEQAHGLAADLATRFRFVELARLNDPEYQSEVLSFVGIPEEAQIVERVHVYNP